MYWPQPPYRQQQPNHPPSPESKKRGFNDDTKADDTKADYSQDESQMDDSQTDEQPIKKRGTTEETEDEIIDISDIMEGHLSQPMITDQNQNEQTLGFFNSILEKFHSLITTHFRTPQNSESPSISSPPPDIKSLITVEISCHSETTRETYKQNYKKTNMEFKSKLELGTIYDNGILLQYRTLLTPLKQELIFAVDQDTCSLRDNMNYERERFQDKLTADAKNRLIMYEKSKDFLRSIKERRYPDNRSSSEQYILNTKDTLNKFALSSYTNYIIKYYKHLIFTTTNYIDVYLLKALTDILSITPNDPIILAAIADVDKYKYEFADLLYQIDQVHSEEDPITKITAFNNIIQQFTTHPVKWDGTTYIVNEDIYKLILLHEIIDKVIVIHPIIVSNNDLKKQISEIDDIFKTFISNSVKNNLPLFLKNSNFKKLFFNGILKHSFWRSEIHSLLHYDTKIYLMPNAKEPANEVDFDYGLHIFALMLNLNSSSQRLILPKSEIPTRATHRRKQKEYPFASALTQVESSMWRKHNLQNPELNILDTIVNIFKQNWFGSFGNLQDAADLELFTFIKYKLDSEIFNIESILFTGQIRIASPEEPEYNESFMRILKEIARTDPDNPFRFAYCRVIEFTHFLTLILIGKQGGKKIILLSELIYLFQYLLQFDYVIYFLTGCRECQPGQIPQQILRIGGNKRQTLKRRTYKKKTLKRKNLKRKTIKRRVKKRK